MRCLVLTLALAGCAASSIRPAPPRDDPPTMWLGSVDAVNPKVSPALARQWRASEVLVHASTALLITVADGVDLAAAKETLISFGASWVSAVSATRTVVAMLPNEALAFIIPLPLVAYVDAAAKYSPPYPRAIDTGLSQVLALRSRTRPYAIRGIGQMSGCLDAARRETMRTFGAIVYTVIADPGCTRTIFTYVMPLAKVVALADIPWITVLSGSVPRDPAEDEADTKRTNEAG